MKHIYNYILSLVVLFVPVLADAQDPPIYNEGYHIENGIATKKTVSETMDANGYYTLTLETFATGATSITQKSIPSDIILVLDLSTSMGGHRGDITRLSVPTALSYNDVVTNSNYVVWHDEHAFGYQLFGLERQVGGQTRYYLYWIAPGGTYHSGVYFVGQDGVPSVAPASQPNGYDINLLTNIPSGAAYATSPTATIATIPAASGASLNDLEICEAGSRITELKYAVSEFISEIDDNDKYKIVNGQKVPRDEPLNNRVSIVTFAGDLLGGRYETDLLELTTSNLSQLQSLAQSFTLKSGTRPDLGIQRANEIFRNNSRTGTVGTDYLRTIVFFTDGKPDTQSSYSGDNRFTPAIQMANVSKQTTGTNAIGASVYSVGLFSGSDLTNVLIPKFMKLVSSNCPDATSINSAPADQNPNDQINYYFNASSSDVNLSDVFKTIAQASGGSEKTVPSATQVVDGVTNSFTIPTPAGASAPTLESAQVTIFTRSINAAGTAWGSSQNLTLVEMTTEEEIQVPDPNKEYMSDASKVGAAIVDGKLFVMGFDYSKADSAGELNGNWVGWRYPDGTDASKTCAGKELVIQFKIQGDPDATGGDSTQTNTADSGIYVPVYDESGKFVGYDPANQYELPHADIPINLVIIKEGLRHGESATIQIYRAPQSSEYNPTTGKLKPYLPNGDDSWENFSKVILTNKGEDGAPVTETLLCLDPTYVYLMKEDDWGWSYNLVIEAIDTSMQEKNPFIFTNTEKTDAVRHAEAASFNRFGDDLHGRQRTETVKSSKVKTFITTPATGSGK